MLLIAYSLYSFRHLVGGDGIAYSTETIIIMSTAKHYSHDYYVHSTKRVFVCAQAVHFISLATVMIYMYIVALFVYPSYTCSINT